jgi:hypothetical protein
MLTSPITVRADGRRSSTGPPSPPHPVQFRDSPLGSRVNGGEGEAAAVGQGTDAAAAVAAASTDGIAPVNGGGAPTPAVGDGADSVTVVMRENASLVVMPVAPSEAVQNSLPNLRRGSEDESVDVVEDPISSWRWGALPEQGAIPGSKGWSAGMRTPRRRLDSESSTNSDGTQAPGFQVRVGGVWCGVCGELRHFL